ncbi:MAG: glycosyltransferase family 1 protein [Cyanobacteria bacterium P01_G01_bin.49]
MIQDEGRQLAPILVSLIPNLMGGEGHIIPYHQAVSQAVTLLGWKHRIIVPVDSKIAQLPPNWDECLNRFDLEKKGNFIHKFLRLEGTWELGKSIADYLNNKVINQAENSIIFLERFIHLQLLALLIALYLVPRDKLSVWLLYRRDTHNDKTKFIYKFLNSLIKKRLNPNHFKLLTDSDLLSQALSNYFQETVVVMPSPHTDTGNYHISSSDNSQILCWWPGSPREEKGLETIKNLIDILENYKDDITLICSQNSQVNSNITNLKLIQNHLTREEYHHWLRVSTIILLPYNPTAYQARTSGIFTESIMASKIPLVTHGTWMAYELFNYNLAELVIDWQEPKKVFELIEKVVKSDKIWAKLRAMQQRYQQFHSVNNYGRKMETLYQEMIITKDV